MLWGVDLAGLEDDVELTLPPDAHPVRTAGVHRVLEAGLAARAHVFNLGHGVAMEADPDAISAVVRTVHDWRAP